MHLNRISATLIQLLLLAGMASCSGEPEPEIRPAITQPVPQPTLITPGPSPSPTKVTPASPTQKPWQVREPITLVTVKGLDFRYEVSGRVRIERDLMTLTFGRPLPNKMQTWQYKFDLKTKKYSSQVSDDGAPSIPWDKDQPFTLSKDGDDLVMVGDAVEDDGTMLVKGAIAFRIPRDEAE